MNTVVCPNCGKDVEISLALTKQVGRELLAKQEEKHKKELEEAKKETLEKSEKKLQDQFAEQIKQIKEDALAQEMRNKELTEQITKLMKDLRNSKRERDETKIEMEKRLLQEEEKIRADAQKKAEEEQKLKFAEKEKQLQDALKASEDMRRKLTQGSQQLQGESFEQAFENMLKSQYPNDKVMPVGKGIRGGDIIQEVWDGRGNYSGKILWELKNTKSWSEQWVDKLKGDKRTINADEAVLISEVLPDDIKIAGFRKSIWVTQRNFVVPLADTMRAKLIQMYYVKNSVQAKDTKMEILYGYLSGTEFKHRVEAIIDAFSSMQVEVEKEKRYFSNKWARDEKNIRQVIDNTYGMHGDLKGIIGNGLAQIKGLEDGVKTNV